MHSKPRLPAVVVEQPGLRYNPQQDLLFYQAIGATGKPPK